MRGRIIEVEMDKLLKQNGFQKTYTIKYSLKKMFFRAVKNEDN